MDTLWVDAKNVYYNIMAIETFMEHHWYLNKSEVKKFLIFLRDKTANGNKLIYRKSLKWIAENSISDINSLIETTEKYGCWSDFLYLLGTPADKYVINIFANQLRKDKELLVKKKDISTVAKWAPSEKSSYDRQYNFVNKICKVLRINKVDYRKYYLKPLRDKLNLIETKISKRRWDLVDYKDVNKSSLYIYRRCFNRNDHDNYHKYIKIIDTKYEFTNKSNNTIIIDTSGSMYGYGLDVALKISSKIGGTYYNFEKEIDPYNIELSEEVYCETKFKNVTKYIFILSDTPYEDIFEEESYKLNNRYPDSKIIHWEINKCRGLCISNSGNVTIIKGYNDDMLYHISNYCLDEIEYLEKRYFKKLINKYLDI